MATALFLAVTAAFGGLSTAEGAPVPHLERGQEHRNQQFALTVDSAYLRTPGGVAPDRRELVVYVDAVNLWTSPQLTAVEGLRLNRFRDAERLEAIRARVFAGLEPVDPGSC